jgi:DNA-binding transcriptional ArsR family regulator
MATILRTAVPSTAFTAQAAEAADALKLLAHEGRLLVLCYLADTGELSAGELSRSVGLSHSAMSQHLARLREEGLVATRKDAQTVIYRIADPKVHRILALLKELYCPELGHPNIEGDDQ